jgi:hypothetical protein
LETIIRSIRYQTLPINMSCRSSMNIFGATSSLGDDIDVHVVSGQPSDCVFSIRSDT